MSQLLKDYIIGTDGKSYRVSTIVTLAGGAPIERAALGSPFMMEDYPDYNAWPYETMVFAGESSIGLYHAPYASEHEARCGHTQIVEAIKLGSEWGGGVQGPNGTPSISPDQWEQRRSKRLPA